MTDKQRRFVEEYCVDFNATQAAVRAGYSERTAGQTGHEYLKKPEIRAAIDERLDELTMSTEEALVRLAEMGRAVQTQYISDDGTVDLAAMRRDGKMHLVRGINYRGKDADRLVVEFHDAKDAIDKILRARGAYGAKGTEDDPVVTEVRVTIRPPAAERPGQT